MHSKPMNRTALITGASSGIGYELARVFVERGYDVVLVARRVERLEQIKLELLELRSEAKVWCVPVDLSKPRGAKKVLSATEELGIQVDTLVNNAGAAWQGEFADMSRGDLLNIVALNVRTLTELTYLYLPGMRHRRNGRILNVASVVGFQAIPTMAVYAASKAYVLSLTESLSEELRACGITVTALCPGLTRTEMVSDLGVDEFAGTSLIMDDPRSVALSGYRALHRREVLEVPGLFNKMAINWAEYQPRWLKRSMAGIASRSLRKSA